MEYSAVVFAMIGIAFVLAGMVKGILGMGLPTVAMGLLGLAMAPAYAAAVVVVPALVTNVWQLVAGPNVTRVLSRFAVMMVAICIGTWLGLALLAGASKAATATLGIVLAVYGVTGLVAIRFHVPKRLEVWLSPPVGFVTGVLTGATGIFVIPAVPYFAALDLDREALIQTLGLAFSVSTLALAAGLYYTGHLQATTGAASLLALVPAVAGMLLGQRIRMRLRPEVFRKWFFAGLVPLGSYMALRALLA